MHFLQIKLDIMDHHPIEENFELILGDYRLRCMMHQDQESFTILCQDQTSTTPQYYFKQVVNESWIKKDQLYKLCYGSSKQFYQALKSKYKNKELVLHGQTLSIQKMMQLNKKFLDAQIQLKKVEYTQMEKSLMFANQNLNNRLLDLESKNFQLQDLKRKLQKDLNNCQEKMDLQIFTTKKLSKQIKELQISIENLKDQNEKELKQREMDIKNLQNELAKQKKRTQLSRIKGERQAKTIQQQRTTILDFQREVKILQDSYKKKLLSEDVTNQKLGDNQIQIKNYLTQIKKKGEIIEELTQQLAKTTANLKEQNFRLRQNSKIQKEFYIQELTKSKKNQQRLIKQHEDIQKQLKNTVFKEKEQHQRSKKRLNEEILKLQDMFQNHLELDITSNSYRDIRNQFIEIENLIII